jgi:predicted dithiol-disulfide oxidoreductase (DUF899 family)
MIGRNSGKLGKKISALEKKIVSLRAQVNALRKREYREEVPNYLLKNWTHGMTSLSQLFGAKKDLIIVHNMGAHCPYCTLWADGFNGVLQHLEDRAAFAVVSPDLPRAQKDFARPRGWKFRMLSGHGSTFIRDAGFWADKGDFSGPLPGVSTYAKEKGKIYRVSRTGFGPGDDFCGVWHLFDLLKNGADGWTAKFSYKK